jgi:hypothetical protein
MVRDHDLGTTKIATWHINYILGKINKNKNLF